ncbi:MAG: rod shape-determining protein MreC [Flavobacteriales bacterium]|nr:rod shape-determining protein MreC [Bacteroidales bacterium AH-315-I05]PCJ83000.1 MAG: rod shape-determining protein MreC [Flavobacteriales bacterium]
MQNLFNFIWKRHFTFLFLLLEVLAFTLLVQYNKFHKASFLSSTNEISGNVYSLVNNITDYFNLKEVNELLAKENARLKSISPDAFLKVSHDLVFINDTVYKQQYRYLGAKVINNTIYRRNNYIVLNKGRIHGIESGMGIISPNGVVGIVKNVSENFCSAISVLHKKTRISAKLRKNNYFGILTWEENDSPETATLTDIPSHVDLQQGDAVVARGSSVIYPEGTLIGFVDKLEQIPGTDFYKITLRLSTDFRNLSYCYVVRNLLKTEQLELQTKFEEKND